MFIGSGVAIVTPFNENGTDFDRLSWLIDYQIKEKTDAVIVCGTTGEASTMPDEEHKEVIRFAVEKTAKRVPVIAGTGSNDTRHAVELSKFAESVGADGILSVTPYYNKTTQKGLLLHFKEIAENINIPVMLYNVPSRTGLNISPETALKLSKIKNITSIKEANSDIGHIVKLASLCAGSLDIYSGNDDMIFPIMALGGKGVVSVAANIVPRDIHDIVEFYEKGDIEGSRNLQLKLIELISALFIEVNPIPIKTAMNLLGLNAGILRSPLCEMTDSNLEILKGALINYGFKL